MRKLNHTPGPLRAIREGHFSSIIPVNGGPDVGQILKREDAVLYAAAPEILEALIEGVKVYGDNFDDIEQCEHIHNSIKIIERATGKKWEEL